MSSRFGLCRNQDYCSLAVQGTVLRLDSDELFVCPECARPLSPTAAWDIDGRARVLLRRLVGPLLITVLGATVLAQGFRHPEKPPATAPAAQPVAAQARLAPPSRPKAPPARLAQAAPAKPEPATPPLQATQPARPTPPPLANPPLATTTLATPALAKPPLAPPTLAPPKVPQLALAHIAPPPELVLLRVDAAPPLNIMLVPQLAAGFLTKDHDGHAAITSSGGLAHVALATGGPTLAILVRPAVFDAPSLAAGQSDLSCTAETPGPAQLQQAGPLSIVPISGVPGVPRAAVVCYARPGGLAGDFATFLAGELASRIVAATGYPPPPPPAPPAPPPLPPQPVAQTPPERSAKPGLRQAAKLVAKPAAKVASKSALKPAAKIASRTTPKPDAPPRPAATADQAPPNRATPDRATPDRATPDDAAPASAPSGQAAATSDADSTGLPDLLHGDAPQGPRVVHVAPGTMSMDSIKALTTPDPAAPTGATPHQPQKIYLPASARFSFGPVQGGTAAGKPMKMVFVDPSATKKPVSVKVDCEISKEGLPSDCHQLDHLGVPAATAILAWLPTGAIHFAPGTKDGHPIAERRTLTVNYGKQN